MIVFMKKLGPLALGVMRSKVYRKLLILFGFAVSFTVYAISMTTEDRHHFVTSELDAFHRVNKRQVAGFVQKYEELKWYSDEEPYEEIHQEMPSVVFLGKYVPKFDRTLLSLQSFNHILDGKYDDYLEFVNEQDTVERLTWDQFQALQIEAKSAVSFYRGMSPGQIREVLEFAIVLNEIASSKMLQKKAWVYEISGSDDRSFVKEILLKHPEIFPTCSRFNFEQQRLLQEIYGLLDLQKIFALRDLRATFEGLKKGNLLHNDPGLFDLAFLVEESLFAGSRGNIYACGSVSLTSHGYGNLVATRQAIGILKDSSERDAFKFYLGRRADWLGYDPGSPLNRVLTKFGAMMELFTEADGKALKEAFLRLKPEELSVIVSEFDEVQLANNPRVFENVGVFFQNLAENRKLGHCEKERLSSTVRVGFPFLVKVVNLATKQGVHNVDLGEAARLAEKDPEALSQEEISMAKDGHVLLGKQ